MVIETAQLAAARAGDHQTFSRLTEPYRRELLVHCYRLLGSLHEAEDLVQETLLRAWQRLATFEGRASLRAWLYKIATNACLDALDRRPRRSLPPLSRPPADPLAPIGPPSAEPIWLEPFPDALLDELDPGPEARYLARESITLAFLTALHVLPPRQRAVLLLRDVLAWHAREVADLLDLTVPAVNSALHRARVTLARHRAAGRLSAEARQTPADTATRALLDRYVEVWEAADVAGLVLLLREDAALAMPPSPAWYQGRAAVGAFLAATVFADDAAPLFPGPARGRWRLRPARANARPAFGLYQRDPVDGVYRGMGLIVVETAGGQITDISAFLAPGVLDRFELPAWLEG